MAKASVRTVRARDTFLKVLEKSCNVSAAARAAGIGRSTAYDWRDADEAFAKDWDAAEATAVDDLEQVAWDRAKAGLSDRMLEILLKGHRPDRFVERTKVDMNVSGLSAEIEASRRRIEGE